MPPFEDLGSPSFSPSFSFPPRAVDVPVFTSTPHPLHLLVPNPPRRPYTPSPFPHQDTTPSLAHQLLSPSIPSISSPTSPFTTRTPPSHRSDLVTLSLHALELPLPVHIRASNCPVPSPVPSELSASRPVHPVRECSSFGTVWRPILLGKDSSCSSSSEGSQGRGVPRVRRSISFAAQPCTETSTLLFPFSSLWSFGAGRGEEGACVQVYLFFGRVWALGRSKGSRRGVRPCGGCRRASFRFSSCSGTRALRSAFGRRASLSVWRFRCIRVMRSQVSSLSPREEVEDALDGTGVDAVDPWAVITLFSDVGIDGSAGSARLGEVGTVAKRRGTRAALQFSCLRTVLVEAGYAGFGSRDDGTG